MHCIQLTSLLLVIVRSVAIKKSTEQQPPLKEDVVVGMDVDTLMCWETEPLSSLDFVVILRQSRDRI